MSGVTIKEYGLRFVQVCLKEYWGECLFLVLFLAGLIWTLFCNKKQMARIFLYYTIFLCLTVYNPLLVKYVIDKLNFENEYYRFFWILPVIPGLAYYAVRIISERKTAWKKGLVALGLVVLIIFAGVPLQGVVKNFSMIENVYKVPNDLRAICDVIKQHKTEENPSVIFDQRLNSVARQYDASLRLILNRDAVLYRAGSDVVHVNPKKESYKRQKTIMDVLFYNEAVSKKKFKKALDESGADYLVIPISFANHDYLKDVGCEAIAQTQEYVIYTYIWEAAEN